MLADQPSSRPEENAETFKLSKILNILFQQPPSKMRESDAAATGLISKHYHLCDHLGRSMNTSRENPQPAGSAWQLEFARLIAFPAEPPLFLEQEWWKELASEVPEDYVSTRKKHAHEDHGSLQGCVLTLKVDLGRIVWLAQPPGDFDDLSGKLPTLGAFREKIDWFVGLLTPWLANSCPPLKRLAFASKLLQPASTQQEAFRVLAAHLPLMNFEQDPNDFVLQINRRRDSRVVGGLPINRVSTWSKLNVTFSIEAQGGIPFKWPENCYSAVELDINTAPERVEILPRELLPQLFMELASLGEEIAERGDTP